MTDRQARFCEEYLSAPSASEAAVRAGYSQAHATSTASRLLSTNANVKSLIAELQAERARSMKLTADAVLEALWAEARGLGADSTPSARVTALKACGQHLGMFVQRVETTDLTDMTADRVAQVREALKVKAESLRAEA